ncbi:flagellar hook-length control protein FliK [Rhodopila sp.]|jgi:flagellar hook-length control protein FliK|uniref:flagellar hook-length control protein FliK n=1 Tax=Rhodopila sp. TaxID=2480087 RepID=UPI002CE7A887|nr:flagellar hook-length control protein FliK [Rhodopila sp.]HVZ08745.1 flagellar hook-length control protein FliK [Rhodopila sp.]
MSVSQTASGADRVTVRLHPAELGMVQVRIERGQDGATQVTVTAEKPGTLTLLQRDHADLHRALDQAGIPADGRTLSFHAAAVTADAGTNQGAGSQGAGSQGGDASHARTAAPHGDTADADGRGNAASQDLQGGGSRHGGQGNGSGSPNQARRHLPLGRLAAGDADATAWRRVGLDITA